MTEKEEQLWEHIRKRQPSIVMGMGPVLHLPKEFKTIRINCTEPWTIKGPLRRAYQQIRNLLGEGDKDTNSPSKEGGLRYQLLDEIPVPLFEQGFAVACNRLVDVTKNHTVLFFDAIEQADQTVLEALEHLLSIPDTLHMPWIIPLQKEPQGELAKLVEKLKEAHGKSLFFEEDTPQFENFDWRILPPDALCVLRAGSVIGNVFEASLVAHLLQQTQMDVLKQLQVAVDLGAPIGDYGNCRFFLPSQSIEELQHRMLPSLLTYWHEQLAEWLSGTETMEHTETHVSGFSEENVNQTEQPEHREADSSNTPKDEPTTAEKTNNTEASQTQNPGQNPVLEAKEPQESESDTNYREFYQSGEEEFPPSFEEIWTEEEPIPDEEQVHFSDNIDPIFSHLSSFESSQSSEQQEQRDRARAAEHLQAAGKTREALINYLEAAKDASRVGDTKRGIYLTKKAIQLINVLPETVQHAVLKARILVEMARLQWHGSLESTGFSLKEAAQSIEAARETLPPQAPLELLGRIAAVNAGIHYDVGDLEALTYALQELTRISRLMLQDNASTEAARLLNDQAALYIRLGDPLQASHLLYSSRTLFERRLQQDPQNLISMEELAETEHLLAKLPLHAPVQPGREREAYALGLKHTEKADQLYKQLRQPREQARILETKGRLEMGRQELDRAEFHLAQAIKVQKQLGDLTGLARSTGTMAELLTERKQFQGALQMLEISMSLNLEKGSPIGIAFNRHQFEFIVRTLLELEPNPNPSTQEELQQIERWLDQAETQLGRIPLPRDKRKGILHTN